MKLTKLLPYAFSLALGTTSCFMVDTPDKRFSNKIIKQKWNYTGKRWKYNDYIFIPQGKDVIQRFNMIPNLHPNYRIVNLEIRNSKGEVTHSKKLIQKSNSDIKAITYVDKGLTTILKEYRAQTISEKDNGLAKAVVKHFHKDISIDQGKGQFTLDYEALGDSTFTLSEFISNNYQGDCDDFSLALVSAYEIARTLSKHRQEPFWKKLYSQLQHYQVVSMAEKGKKGHNLNMIITYNQDFSKATLHPLEPQKIKQSLEQDVIVGNKNCLYHIKRKKEMGSITQEIRPIMWFFNSKLSYYNEYQKCK